VYHESARSIVFRDHVRRADAKKHIRSETEATGKGQGPPVQVDVKNFQPIIQPLPSLELGPHDQFEALLTEGSNEETWNVAEKEVVGLLRDEYAVVKTLKNQDWTSFLDRFRKPQDSRYRSPNAHDDIPPHDHYHFNSFVTSTSLLPAYGKKMRCYGSLNEYSTGVVFALPRVYKNETEDDAVSRTQTWAWPSGYSAKTEFNIDGRGNLTNGREEALVSLKTLRSQNHDYVHKEDYYIAGRLVKGGLNTIPYNEVYVRVGGLGRLVDDNDCGTGEMWTEESMLGRSLDNGVGLPIALFVRTATFGHLVSLLRTRARMAVFLGQSNIRHIPLLLISPEIGVRVLTEKLQAQLLKVVSKNLNPFQNPALAYKTTIDSDAQDFLQQKYEELIDLDEDGIEQILTPEERARLAGGFGATDDSVAKLLMEAKEADKKRKIALEDTGEEGTHRLQDLVNEGLAAAVRSGDYHTSRQLLILYSLVASAEEADSTGAEEEKKIDGGEHSAEEKFDDAVIVRDENNELSKNSIPAPPPPPPLDTDRLRSATNSDGLLAVLGAAQVLKAMQDGGAKRRTEEAVLAMEEWVEHGEQSIAFRLASWHDQRAAQGDLKIAVEHDSNMMAFVSNKAISNRKGFAKKLRKAIEDTDFESVHFLDEIYAIVSQMHSPCLRLELLQYVLGLDNRYSVAHVARSVELAAQCLSMPSREVSPTDVPLPDEESKQSP
jgi:hypothetical protein